MEQKNLLLAIILSAIIMVGFQWYNGTQRPPKVEGNTVEKHNSELPNLPIPSSSTNKGGEVVTPSKSNPQGISVPIPGSDSATTEARALKRALTQTPRIKIESDRVIGSISLVGGRIDDLTLKNYRETIEPDSKNISLLIPFGSAKPYYADFGWVSGDTKVPNSQTIWQSNKLKKFIRL